MALLLSIRFTSKYMKIITHNPYRLFGVYANSSTKDRLANAGKLNAFLQVGKSLSFPLDAAVSGFDAPQRTAATLATAKANLTLPQDQLHYAQFWFLSLSALDNVACKHLEAGRTQEAISVWAKQDNLSSLQNRLVCMLLAGDYAEVMSLAERLYPRYAEAFAEAILGDTANISGRDLGLEFLATLSEELGLAKVLPHVQNAEWRRQLSEQNTQPLIDKILQEVAEAKKAPNNPKAELEAARKLMRQTYKRLQELRQYLAADNAEYAVVADKLGLQILQCGINYYNASEDEDAAHQAMEVQSFASRVVVGAMAKARCKENTDILKRIIDALPPREVMSEYKEIENAMDVFCSQPDEIRYSQELVEACTAPLARMKAKLGEGHPAYLRQTTRVVKNAMHNLVEEVNAAQARISSDSDSLAVLLGMAQLESVLRAAWLVTLRMDGWELEADYASHYRNNRTALRDLCQQLQVDTSDPNKVEVSAPRPEPQRRPQPQPRPQPRPATQPTSSPDTSSSTTSSSRSSSSDDDMNWGCIIAVAIGIIIFLVNILG